MAKILARGKGSHEVLGGSGGGKKEAPHAADPSTDAPSVPTTASEGTHSARAPSAISASGNPILSDDDRAEGESFVDVDGGSNGGKSADRDESAAATAEGEEKSTSCVPDPSGVDADLAPREGGELRGEVARSSGEAAGLAAGPTADAADGAAPTAITHKHRTEESSIPTVIPSQGTGGGIEEAPTTDLAGGPQKTAASKKSKKRGGNKPDAEALRSLRRRLERAAARAVGSAAYPSTGRANDGNEERGAQEEAAAKEVWDVLTDMSLSSGDTTSGGGRAAVSLRRLFGDGITAESIAGIALGLRHACRLDAAGTERASQVCGLGVTSCSAEQEGRAGTDECFVPGSLFDSFRRCFLAVSCSAWEKEQQLSSGDRCAFFLLRSAQQSVQQHVIKPCLLVSAEPSCLPQNPLPPTASPLARAILLTRANALEGVGGARQGQARPPCTSHVLGQRQGISAGSLEPAPPPSSPWKPGLKPPTNQRLRKQGSRGGEGGWRDREDGGGTGRGQSPLGSTGRCCFYPRAAVLATRIVG